MILPVAPQLLYFLRIVDKECNINIKRTYTDVSDNHRNLGTCHTVFRMIPQAALLPPSSPGFWFLLRPLHVW